MKIPIISFIIPVYNAQGYLRELLDSIIIEKMIHDVIEVILVNDGSTDKSEDIIQAYAKKYKFIKTFSFPNQGVYKTRNFALGEVSGRYVWFIDADDLLLPNAIQIILRHVETNEKIDIFTFGYEVEEFNHSIRRTPPIANKQMTGIDYLEKNDGRLYLWNNIYLASFLKNYELKFFAKSHSLEDSLFNIMAFTYARKVYCLDEILYFYRLNNNSISKTQTLENRLKQGESSINVHTETFKFCNKFKAESREYQVIKDKLAHSVLGFYFSLLKERYPINYIKKVFHLYKQNKLIPVKRKNNSFGISFFQFCVNNKYPFLLICSINRFLNSVKK